MTVPMIPGTRPPAPIPGLVDGELIAARDADDNLCLHLMVHDGPLSDGIQIEFVVGRDDARLLQRSLVDGRSTADPLPCRVGIRLRHTQP